jgi:hypothetical protein
MENLYIAATISTAHVDFNGTTGELVLRGVSIPENADQFFRPLHNWIDLFIKVYSGKVNVHICLTYFNTSTIRHFLPFMQRLIQNFNGRLVINWQYEESDDELLERGQELSEVLRFPFQYEAIPDQD